MKVLQPTKFKHQPFIFFLRRSTYIHTALLVLLLAGGKIVFEIGQEQRKKNLEIIQASVRVDMVAMPTQTLNELKNISSETPAANEKVETKVEVKEAEKVAEKIEEKVEEKVDNSASVFEEAESKKRKDFLSKLNSIAQKKLILKKINGVR